MNQLMLFLFFITVGAFSSDAKATSLEKIDIKSWGYQDAELSKYSEQYCLAGFTPVLKEYREIKSKKHSTELGSTFYRFTIIKEEYESTDKAKARFADIKNPSFPNSKVSKMCALRKGFIIDTAVYQIQTDVAAFRKELTLLTEKMEVLIKDEQFNDAN